jgi:hypothetical protein
VGVVVGLAGIAIAGWGCARPLPVDLALEAQGGPLGAFTREVEARVHYGFPGVWRWELAYEPPQRLRFSLHTTGAPQDYVFDGTALHSYLGGTPVSSDRRDAAAYRSIARWLRVTSLEVRSEAAGVTWGGVAGDALGGDAVRGVWLRFHSDGARYVLGFDAEDRLVSASGPIEIPGIGAGRLQARFSEFRSVEGYRVPFAGSYRLNGEPFFDERVIRFVPGRAVLDPAR